MPCNARKFVRVTKFLLAGVTVFCVSWIACVSQWHAGVRWGGRGVMEASTMRTIVAYSEGKQAEMDRPSPVTCDSLPAFPDIPHINRSWYPGVGPSSWQRVAGTRVSLYAAYYDDRASQRYVRILATFHGRNFSTEEPLFCQTRPLHKYEDSVEVVAAKPLEIWWHEWDVSSSEVETPLLLSCPLTEPLTGPSVVSVVTQPCDNPTNGFIVNPRQTLLEYPRTFTVCVKDMNFQDDITQNIREWIEINKILGVDMIDVYIDSLHKNSERILQYYENKGFVRLFYVPIKYNAERTLWQRRRDHILTYNDCLYRNLRESEYVVPLDVDEIVLPKVAHNLQGLVKRLEAYGWDPVLNSAILVQNVFFFDFLQGVYKYKSHRVHSNKSRDYIKRDDVRIREERDLDMDEIELVGDSNIISGNIDEYTDEDIYEEYKSRCGKELTVPKLAKNVVRSAVFSPVGAYSKSLMLTRKVQTAFNHYPLTSLGTPFFMGWPAPMNEVQLNHYKESCNASLVECARYGRRARIDTHAQRLRRRLLKALAKCCQINCD